MPEPPSDAEIVAGCLAGRKDSWDLFVERFSRLVYWCIRRTLKNGAFRGQEDIADEIFQEIFRKLLENNSLSALRDRDSLRKFLIIAAVRGTRDKIKWLERRRAR